MGSSAGLFPKPRRLQQLIGEAQETSEAKKLDADVNALLEDILARANERSPDQTKTYLDQLREAVSDEIDIEQLLLAGSVAKNTYVDELSDVDALAILDRQDLQGKSPQEVLTEFHRLVRSGISAADVKTIKKGKMAVTVTYRDGTEIQLLPALRSGSRVSVPRHDEAGWNETQPKVFQRALSRANQKMNGALVPTIKLVKKVMATVPRKKQLTGYHCESLALDAVKDYDGPKTPKALLLHVLDKASQRVMRPIRDTTGQSRLADEYLGKVNSANRRLASDALAGLARRLGAATTVDQWQGMIEGPG